MTHSKHSSAPWSHSEWTNTTQPEIAIHSADGQWIADVVFDQDFGDDLTDVNQLDNARLITAAPELLASLQELETAIRFHFLPLVEQYAGTPAAHAKDDALARAIAAIKRATQD